MNSWRACARLPAPLLGAVTLALLGACGDEPRAPPSAPAEAEAAAATASAPALTTGPRASGPGAVTTAAGVAVTPVTTPLRVTLDEAILLSFQRDEDLIVHRYAVPIAATAVDVQRAAFDPQAVVSASRNHVRTAAGQETIDTPAGPIPVPVPASSTLTDSATAQVTQPLPTGTSLTAGATLQRLHAEGSPPQVLAEPFVQVTQSLLRGASLSANLAALREARLDLRISRYELRAFAQQLLGDVEDAYWDYDLALRQVAIVRASEAVARQQEQQTDERIRLGTLPETERAAAHAEVAAREQDRIDADAAVEKARLSLLRLLGPRGVSWWGRPVELATDPTTLAPEPSQPVEERVLVAMVLRPDLNEARLRIAQGDLAVVASRNGLLPRLDFFAIIDEYGYGQALHGAVRNINGTSYDLTAGLSLTVDLLNRAERAQYRHDLLTRDQSQAALQNLEQQAEVEVRTAATEVARAQAQTIAAAATASAREATLASETGKLAVGRSTALAVAQAQRDLLASRLDAARALIAERKALVALAQADGSLLQRRGVVVEGAAPAEPIDDILVRCRAQGLLPPAPPSPAGTAPVHGASAR